MLISGNDQRLAVQMVWRYWRYNKSVFPIWICTGMLCWRAVFIGKLCRCTTPACLLVHLLPPFILPLHVLFASLPFWLPITKRGVSKAFGYVSGLQTCMLASSFFFYCLALNLASAYISFVCLYFPVHPARGPAQLSTARLKAFHTSLNITFYPIRHLRKFERMFQEYRNWL